MLKLSAKTLLWLGLLYWGLTCVMPAHAAPTAIWMWEQDSEQVLEHPAKAKEMMAFLKRRNIDTLYLYADAHSGRHLLLSQPQLYKRLIEQLHQRGIKVHALLGSWPLHTERYILPENREQALLMVQRVLDYNHQAPELSRFDGINLDIEPHVLDDWSVRKEEYLQMFLNVSESWMTLKRQMNQNIQIGPAMAFWLDGIEIEHAGRRKPASEHLQDIYDHVVLMDYRDHAHGPDGILSHASQELEYARKTGKRVMLGVETSPSDIRKLSFNHTTAEQMAHELDLVSQTLKGHPAFAGFVVHHYGSYRAWLKQ
jgi:hypothetical protein